MLKRLLILATPLLAAACVTDGAADTLSGSAAAGKAFAQENCASCHALEDGVSPNPDAPSLLRAAHRMPEWMVEGSFERGVQVGHTGQMPVFVFEDDDIANLLAYFEVLRATGLSRAESLPRAASESSSTNCTVVPANPWAQPSKLDTLR